MKKAIRDYYEDGEDFGPCSCGEWRATISVELPVGWFKTNNEAREKFPEFCTGFDYRSHAFIDVERPSNVFGYYEGFSCCPECWEKALSLGIATEEQPDFSWTGKFSDKVLLSESHTLEHRIDNKFVFAVPRHVRIIEKYVTCFFKRVCILYVDGTPVYCGKEEECREEIENFLTLELEKMKIPEINPIADDGKWEIFLNRDYSLQYVRVCSLIYYPNGNIEGDKEVIREIFGIYVVRVDNYNDKFGFTNLSAYPGIGTLPLRISGKVGERYEEILVKLGAKTKKTQWVYRAENARLNASSITITGR